MTYNIGTTAWRQFGLRVNVEAPNADCAKRELERRLYGTKDEILAGRHDWSGDGFSVDVTNVEAV